MLCLCVSGAGDFCFSGGVDGSVRWPSPPLTSPLLTLSSSHLFTLSPTPPSRAWTIPPPTIDPYDTYDASVAAAVLEGHQDSVWSLAYSVARAQVGQMPSKNK